MAAATTRELLPPGPMVLGRDHPRFGDPAMAPRHAELVVGRREVSLRDLGSRAGTRANGEAISGTRLLEPGDVVRLGDATFVFARGAADAIPPEQRALGASEEMQAVERSVNAVAPRRHTVVVTGETGTGKEVVARAIHDRSGRTGPFVAVNCSTFTEALLPSELFGHVKGAFTGAVGEHVGLFRAARGGTLLLDELADIPSSLQASLLRVLETQEVRPVGGTKDLPVDVRIVATTHTDLIELVQGGRFRADLFARLAQWTIRLPRLAQRRDDIPGLTAMLLPRAEGEGRRLTPDFAEALLVHDWPLNVRGLLNVLSIAVISAESDDDPLDLTPEVQHALWTTRALSGADPAEKPAPEVPRATLDKAELEALMIRFHGHVAAAGRHVGMTRSKLYRLLEAHGLEPGGFRETLARPQGGGNFPREEGARKSEPPDVSAAAQSVQVSSDKSRFQQG